MKVIRTVDAFAAECRRMARPLGVVPTMGSLHEGHMALLRRARADCATVVATVFVNPTQFGPDDDLDTYPRSMDADLRALEDARVDIAFTPSVNEMYPAGFDTSVDVGCVGSRLEGEHRPTHFRGVATVVCKLLAMCRPDFAYFGQKDAQQNAVIRRLNADLNLGAEIVVVPTVRDSDGLALSSRNCYLQDAGRHAARVLYRSLCLAKSLHERGGRDAEAIRRGMRGLIESEPLAMLEYASIAEPWTLEELRVIDGPALVSLAVRIGKTRLIDNILLGSE